MDKLVQAIGALFFFGAIALIGWAMSLHPAKSAVASWYGLGFEGRLMANGEPFDPESMTCAHKTLPFGTVLRLRHRGKVAFCIVRDRGPFVAGRDLDVSRAVARRLGMIRKGVARVTVERVS